ncbi:hypothetical protein CFBP6625_26555 (plasmid) [Agrobacterium tumefaciens]|jgi:hypothetical protein|nr:hypothetical protein CFBP6625_26555 [Agrobacterium tumefaciens]
MNDPTVLSARTNQGGSFDVTAAETGDPIAGLFCILLDGNRTAIAALVWHSHSRDEEDAP